MREITWAGGAKLTWKDVQRIRARKRFTRDDAMKLAERLGVNHETVWRAYKGWSWATVRFKCLPEQYKRCVICHEKFGRRFENGRYRSPKFWEQKETCSRSCFNRYNWVRGVYDHR